VLLLILLAPSLVSAATYYVATDGSGSTCSDVAPCGSINTGISKLSAGDTLYLRGGTYTQTWQSGVTHLNSGSSWSTPITIAAYSGESVTIEGRLQFNDGAPASYIILDHLTLYDGNPLYMASDSHHIRFQFGKLRGKAGASILVSGSAPFVEILHSEIYDAGGPGGTGCTDPYGCYGMYYAGHDCLFDDNRVHDNGGYGFHIYDSGSSSVSNNVVRNSLFYNNGFTDPLCCGHSGNLLISHGTNNQAYNNMLYNSFGGIQISSCTNCKAYNNTIYNNQNYGISTDATGSVIKNNIVYNNGSAIDDYGSGTVFAANLCNLTGGGCTLAGNPLFVNAGAANFHLQVNSPAINAGVSTGPEVTTDFEGNPRPSGPAYDIGADEFNSGGGGGGTPATYFVATSGSDTNSCPNAQNLSTPKQTIAGALACATTGQGDIIRIRAGTYAERIDSTAQTIVGGTSWATATLIANYQNEVVTLAPTGANPVVRFASQSYIILAGLTLDAQSVAQRAIAIDGPADHIRVQNSTLKNGTLSTYRVLNSSSNELIGSTVLGATFNTVYLSDSSQNLIQGNTISAFVTCGIQTDGTSGANTIRDNWIKSPAGGSACDSISLGGTGGNDLVMNNILSNGFGGIHLLTGSVNQKLYNNTLYTHSTRGIVIDAGATGALITNNIVYLSQGIVNNAGATLTTNLTTNPSFVDAAADNYHLAPGSTARNQGTTLAAVPTDKDGVLRPLDGVYDIGAYEEQPASQPPEVTAPPVPFKLHIAR
jgi:parallel beta-helix repeat protein